MNAEEIEAYKTKLKSIGYTDKQVEGIIKLSKKAFAAATEVKTFSQMIDTLKESLGSGWAESFEIIFGDFREAKQLWTGSMGSCLQLVKLVMKCFEFGKQMAEETL